MEVVGDGDVAARLDVERPGRDARAAILRQIPLGLGDHLCLVRRERAEIGEEIGRVDPRRRLRGTSPSGRLVALQVVRVVAAQHRQALRARNPRLHAVHGSPHPNRAHAHRQSPRRQGRRDLGVRCQRAEHAAREARTGRRALGRLRAGFGQPGGTVPLRHVRAHHLARRHRPRRRARRLRQGGRCGGHRLLRLDELRLEGASHHRVRRRLRLGLGLLGAGVLGGLGAEGPRGPQPAARAGVPAERGRARRAGVRRPGAGGGASPMRAGGAREARQAAGGGPGVGGPRSAAEGGTAVGGPVPGAGPLAVVVRRAPGGAAPEARAPAPQTPAPQAAATRPVGSGLTTRT